MLEQIERHLNDWLEHRQHDLIHAPLDPDEHEEISAEVKNIEQCIEYCKSQRL